MGSMRGTVVTERTDQVVMKSDLFGLVFESSLDGRILLREDIISLINQRVQQWSGFTNEEVDGQAIQALLPGIDLVNQEGMTQHLLLTCKQGSPQAVHVIINKVTFCSETFILCTLEEEEKVVHQQSTSLMESGDRWQTLASNSPDLIIITNANLVVEYTNRPSSEPITIGLPGQSILESIPERSRSDAKTLMINVLISGEPKYLYIQYDTEAFGLVFYETLIVQQKRGETVSGLMLIARDITRREKQSLELFESRQQLSSVLNGMPIFIGVLSTSGVILDINQAALDILGRPLSEVVGTLATDLDAFTYSEDVHRQIISAIRKVANGETVRYDFLARVVRGQHLLVHLVISPLYNLSGEVVKLIATGIDISERHRAEVALRHTAINLNLAVKAGNVGLWTWNLMTNDVFFSDEWKAQLGFGPEELENTFATWEQRLHPEDRDGILLAVKRSTEPPWPPINYEFRLRHKDGSYRWVLSQGSLEFDTAGQPVKMYGTHVDITERKNKELAHKENERQLQEAQQIAHLGYWKWNMVNGEFTWSEEAKKIFGYQEHMGEPNPELFLSLIHEEDRQRMKTHLEAVMKKQAIPDVEYRVSRPDGSVRFVFTKSKSITSQTGQVIGISGTLQDITELKHVEQALIDSKSRYKALITNSPDFIMTVGLDYKIQFINRYLDGLTGKEICGHAVFEFVPPNFRKTVVEALEKCYSTHEIQMFETRGPLPRDNPNWYQTRVVPILRDNEVIGYTLIATDITELKRNQSVIYENEERLRQAVNVSRIGIFDHDHHKESIYWSPELREIFGWNTDEEATLEKYIFHVHPDDRATTIDAIRAAHDPTGDGIFDITHRIVDRRGRVRWLKMISRTKFEGTGNERRAVRTIGATEDITERKVAQLLLEESEQRFRIQIDTAPEAIVVFDAKSGKLIDANQNALKLFRKPYGEFLGLEFTDMSPERQPNGKLSRDMAREMINDVLSGASPSFEWVYYTPSRGEFYCDVRLVYLPYGSRKLIRGSITDITERKQMEKRLVESEFKFRSLFELSPVGIALNDLNTGTFLDFNDALLKPTGYTREEFLKLTYWDLTPPEYESEESEQLRSLHTTGYYGPYEKEYVKRDGSRYPILLSGVRLVDHDGRELIWSVVQDITERKRMEDVLKETNTKLKKIEQFIDVTTDAVLVTDEQGQLVYLNKVASERLGIPQEGVSAYNVRDFEEVFMTEGAWKKHLKKLKSMEHLHAEGINTNRTTGRRFPVEVTVRYVTIEENGYVIAISRDITERKNTEEALVKSEYTLRRAQQVAKIGSWVLHHNGILEWSEEAYRIFGLPSGTALSYENFLSLVHPEDKSHVENAWTAAVKGETAYDIIHRIVVSGNVKWLREQAEISLDTDGQFAFAFGTVQDITTLRALQEANLVFDQAQQFAGMGSWRLSITEGEFFWSKSVFDLLGYSPDTIMSYENFIRVIHEKDRAMVESAFDRSKKNKEPFEVEYRIRHASGKIRWIAIKGNFTNDRNGAATEMYGILRNITQEKTHKEELIRARRKAEEAASIKDEFLSVMSHEIRTPLNSVIGLSSLLLKKQPREDQFPLLLTLKKSSDNLWSLINDVLDFNKIQTGNVELEELAFNVSDLLRQIQSSHYPLAMDKGLNLRVTIDPNVPKFLSGDVVRLTQILNNLINNAIKFTSRGFVRLSVHLATRTANSCTVVFEISDSGIGLTKVQQERLFIPFQQADKDITRKFGGTGLGLSIVKGLVNLMKGEISVTSEPQKGSSFSIRLTFDVPKQMNINRVEKDPDSVIEKPLSGFTVLYVEDVESNQLVVQEILHDLGAQCVLADSGKHALKLCLEQRFDVILMDLHMPEMDGYEATKKILRQRKGLNTETAVIAFTADVPSDKLKLKTTSVGIRGIITKPFTNKQIVDKIKEVNPVPLSSRQGKDPILSMDFYENIFNHDSEKLKKIKKVVESDLNRFNKAFLRFDKQQAFEQMREEIHKILPIAKNLKCVELRSLLEEYRKHKTYNDSVNALLTDFTNVMDRVLNSLKSYRY